MTLAEKTAALPYCLFRGLHEDAAAHLCDLLEYCRLRIKPPGGEPFADLAEMVRHYGEKPQPPAPPPPA